MNGDNSGSDSLHVLGIAGSLRAKSYNKSLLRAAHDLTPSGMTIDIFDISNIPFYNGDVEEQGDIEPIAAWKFAIKAADALLFITPEYNYGVPGVLKNAIDWASRPPGKSVLMGKPAAIMGASQGTAGTARAQLQLRQTLAATRVHVMMHPELFVSTAHEKFDQEGRLIDEVTGKYLGRLLNAFADWIRRLRSSDS